MIAAGKREMYRSYEPGSQGRGLSRHELHPGDSTPDQRPPGMCSRAKTNASEKTNPRRFDITFSASLCGKGACVHVC
eukprot:1563205-Pyramimonas_sp.AAC.1